MSIIFISVLYQYCSEQLFQFLYQSFLFYNISVLPETLMSVLSSFD